MSLGVAPPASRHAPTFLPTCSICAPQIAFADDIADRVARDLPGDDNPMPAVPQRA
jgi:hypothetical protein